MQNISTGPFDVNTWIVPIIDNYVIVVDPAACPLTQDETKITNYITSHNIIPIGILLTHGHFDHIMGTAILKNNFSKINLACHSKDACIIGHNALNAQLPSLISMGLRNLGDALIGLPDADVCFSGGETLNNVFSDDNFPPKVKNSLASWKIIWTPGHTHGSVCFYNEKEKCLISGDTIFYHSYGRTDLEGGNDTDMTQSLKKIYSTLPKDTVVYPGHDAFGFELSENIS